MTVSTNVRRLTETYVERGATVEALCKLFNASETTIRSRLRSWGLKAQRKQASRRAPETASRNAALCSSFLEGKSMTEVGEEFGITRERVRQILNENGIGERFLWSAARQETALSEAQRLFVAGKQWTEIAPLVGMSVCALRRSVAVTPEMRKSRRITQFWQLVDITADPERCWLWNDKQQVQGYGRYRWQGKTRGSHVVAYMMSNNIEQLDGWVLHTCDNNLCCNPKHLYEGTPQDNVRDRDRAGRAAHQRPGGIVQFFLTPEDVETIRSLLADGVSQDKVAEICECSVSCVSHIATGKTWVDPKGIRAIPTPVLKQIYYDLIEGRRTRLSVIQSFGLRACTVNDIKNGRHWRVQRFLDESA